MQTILDADQRMRLMKMAMKMEETNGVDRVLDAYDKMVERITDGRMPLGLSDGGDTATELLEGFLAERCVTGGESKLQAKVFYEAFLAWCQGKGMVKENIPTHRRVGGLLRTMYEVHESNVVYYLGINFKER